MFKDYTIHAKQSKHKPSMSLYDYADLHEISKYSLTRFIQNNDSINFSFNRGSVRYYHVCDLDSWRKNNPKNFARAKELYNEE